MPTWPSSASAAVSCSSPVRGEQTELLIISVWQPLFCALIKGAACGLCVSGLCRRRRWPNANITCLIIYVWETGTKAWRGWGGGAGVFIGGTDALRRKRTRCQENVPGVWNSRNGGHAPSCVSALASLYKMVILEFAVQNKQVQYLKKK